MVSFDRPQLLAIIPAIARDHTSFFRPNEEHSIILRSQVQARGHGIAHCLSQGEFAELHDVGRLSGSGARPPLVVNGVMQRNDMLKTAS